MSHVLYCIRLILKLCYSFNFRFDVVGYGCMTCIGNSGPLDDPVADAIEKVTLYNTSDDAIKTTKVLVVL